MADELDALREVQDRLNTLNERTAALTTRRAALIAEARDAGHSWPKIGATLGMSHQGAMKAARTPHD